MVIHSALVWVWVRDKCIYPCYPCFWMRENSNSMKAEKTCQIYVGSGRYPQVQVLLSCLLICHISILTFKSMTFNPHQIIKILSIDDKMKLANWTDLFISLFSMKKSWSFKLDHLNWFVPLNFLTKTNVNLCPQGHMLRNLLSKYTYQKSCSQLIKS